MCRPVLLRWLPGPSTVSSTTTDLARMSRWPPPQLRNSSNVSRYIKKPATSPTHEQKRVERRKVSTWNLGLEGLLAHREPHPGPAPRCGPPCPGPQPLSSQTPFTQYSDFDSARERMNQVDEYISAAMRDLYHSILQIFEKWIYPRLREILDVYG